MLLPCRLRGPNAGYRGQDILAKTAMKYQYLLRRPIRLAQELLAHADVAPIGLGARDSLRLEGGLCLYGHDIDTETTPTQAALNWAIQRVRRSGGDRMGGFPGADVILG